MNDTKKSAKRTTGRNTSSNVWTDEERAAMVEHAKEMKAETRRGRRPRRTGRPTCSRRSPTCPKSDRVMAERIHAVVTASAPDLAPKTYYGMPAYARDGKVVCFFQPADKFKARYATFGFNDDANLDDGSMWPTSWALTKLTAADEKKIGELVKKAVS